MRENKWRIEMKTGQVITAKFYLSDMIFGSFVEDVGIKFTIYVPIRKNSDKWHSFNILIPLYTSLNLIKNHKLTFSAPGKDLPYRSIIFIGKFKITDFENRKAELLVITNVDEKK